MRAPAILSVVLLTLLTVSYPDVDGTERGFSIEAQRTSESRASRSDPRPVENTWLADLVPTTTTATPTTTTSTTSTTTSTVPPTTTTVKPKAPKPVAAPKPQAPPKAGCAQPECWRSEIAKYSWPVEQAMKVMRCESGGNPNAVNERSNARGLFQILGGTLDPVENIAHAHRMWLKRGWQPWVCKP